MLCICISVYIIACVHVWMYCIFPSAKRDVVQALCPFLNGKKLFKVKNMNFLDVGKISIVFTFCHLFDSSHVWWKLCSVDNIGGYIFYLVYNYCAGLHWKSSANPLTPAPGNLVCIQLMWYAKTYNVHAIWWAFVKTKLNLINDIQIFQKYQSYEE